MQRSDAFRILQEQNFRLNSTSYYLYTTGLFQRGTLMKRLYLFLPLLAGFLLSGCYTQLQTIERPSNERSAPYLSGGGMYDTYYEDDLYLAYDQGYYDGLFDANIGFRSYSPHRARLSMGFSWGRPFMGFGYSYGNYYDPYWHYNQLYDPYFYSAAGYFGVPYYMRYRHYGHFYSPFFGSGNVIVYNNYGSGSAGGASYSGPRQSGVHRGNVTGSRQNQLVSRGTSAGDTRTRLRGQGISTLTNAGTRGGGIRTRGSYPPVRGTVDRIRIRTGSASRGSVERRRPISPRSTSRTSPQRRGSSSSGSVGRSRGSSSSSGRVERSRSSESSSRSSGRSRSSSSSSGERKRGGDDGISMLIPLPGPAQHKVEIRLWNHHPAHISQS